VTLDTGASRIVRWKRFHCKRMEVGGIGAPCGGRATVPGDDGTARSRPVTLDDVARKSGVSRATASRALNGHARVSDDVRTRVQLVADRLGYLPNAAARSLASGRAGVLGFVLPGGHLITAPYESRLLEAVADAATAAGYGVMLWMGTTEPGQALREGLRTGLVDGVVVSGVALGAGWVETLFDGPQPCVLVGRHPRRDVPRVELTNEPSASAAVDHLIAGGGRRIALILGPSGRVDGHDRQVGYERALYRNGIELDTRLVERGEFTIDSGYEAMRRLLAHRPDSVFACNDMMAAGAMQAIAEAGLRVPDDIAVMGFDDLPVASRTNPPLSTVSQDIAAIGAAAVDLLIDLVTGDVGDDENTIRTVTGPLVLRQSTRPVAGVGSDAAKHNHTTGVREVRPSRTSVAGSTSSGENRRATS
jgi:LacI family transcriptional regulator